jgi:hypothetical protein
MGRSQARGKLLKRVTSFPEAIRSPFLLVLVLQVAIFVAAPFPDVALIGPIMMSAAACFMLGLAIHASDSGPGIKRLAWLGALLLFIGDRIGKTTNSPTLGIAFNLWLPFMMATAGVLVLRTVLRSKQVGPEQIYAGISFYMMLGLWWATAYGFLDWLDLTPPAFSRDIIAHGLPGAFEHGQYGELLYFSYITLATVGYGDITPTHPITRNLAAFEALAGQIYVAVLLARLVAMQISQPKGDRA